MKLIIEEEVRRAAPGVKVIVVEAGVSNPPTPDALWDEIRNAAVEFKDTPMENVNRRPAIAATRAAYKALGKEPNRYRPSAEALCRRCVKGLELYRSSAIIDLINLLSIRSGHSIGGFDADKIQGDELSLGVGREGEPYEAIHRGPLNIAHMPVIRDAIGGIGTPTSDNDRTKLSDSTTRLLMTINLYNGLDAETMVKETERLLRDYAGLTDFTYNIYC